MARRARRFLRRNPVGRWLAGKPQSPFADPANAPRVIVHTAHHKVGTSWFSAIFRALSEHFAIPLVRDPDELPAKGTAFLLQHRVLVEPAKLDSYKGSHMIRDPRDVAISGYHYHLWTREGWANRKIKDLPEQMRQKWRRLPLDEIGHMSYQEYLNSLPEEAGLLTEIDRCSNTVNRDIFDWNYDDPNVFEFRYEDAMVDETPIFRAMFEHYGFHAQAVNEALDVAARFSFANRTGRSVGEVEGEQHIRSGKLQQWREEYTAEHRQLFKELHADELIKLGYETDTDW